MSCLTILVRRERGPDFVVKQARERLAVKEDWFSDPARIHIEAAAMRALQELVPPGSVPALLFEDHGRHLIAMEAAPEPHENWKTLLLQGRLEADHVGQFARLLSGIHRGSFGSDHFRGLFPDRSFFENLRLEPYYLFSARQQALAAAFLEELVADTRAVALTLVHGDFSPKNVLVHQGRLILLDHEVMHFGDGAFDVGFALTHLLSKARHVAGKREEFLEAAAHFWAVYSEGFRPDAAWERRAVRHTIACLMARVRGKSPLEYLSPEHREQQEKTCLRLMGECPGSMSGLKDFIQKDLERS